MRFYFITNDANIREAFSQMKIPEYSQGREGLLHFVNTPDTCKGSTKVHKFLLRNLNNNHKNTILFIHGGYKVDGLVVFSTESIASETNNAISIKYLCSHKDSTKGTGTALVNKIKELGKILEMDQIMLNSVEESTGFYRKNGFDDLGYNTYMFYLHKDKSLSSQPSSRTSSKSSSKSRSNSSSKSRSKSRSNSRSRSKSRSNSSSKSRSKSRSPSLHGGRTMKNRQNCRR
jgi:hypothetical protein